MFNGLSATAFDGIICLALTAPQRLDQAALSAITSGLDAHQGVETRIQAIRALAAVAYGRPEMLPQAVLGSLVPTVDDPAPAFADAAAEAFQFVATLDVPPSAITAMADLTGRNELAPAVRKALLVALSCVAQWRPELVSLDGMLRAAEASADRAERNVMLCEVIERLVFATPDLFTAAIVERIVAAFTDCFRLRYTLAFLSAHADVPHPARMRADRWLANRFPLRQTASVVIREKPFSLLVIHNVADGQGDEIIRVNPLVQALLDGNASLTVTILTRRIHLYDHPRVIAQSIHDDNAVEERLSEHFDGVVEFYEPQVAQVNYRPELTTRLREYIAARRPTLLIRASKGQNHFTFETVQMDNRSIARSHDLDRVSARNVYDAVQRLLIELGLPLRLGDKSYRAPSLLVGTASSEAAAVWQQLRKQNRPVVLVNAFGGREPLKGFTADKAASLAAQISDLIDEGFQALLLPNGEAWGSTDVIAGVLQHLDAAHRTSVAVAPDPMRAYERMDPALSERPELSMSDRVMRLLKYFASYADLVVTVEGWFMHVAFALGRPFRLCLAPYSHGFDWHPRSRGPDQRLVTRLSGAANLSTQDLVGGGIPPQPFQPRKAMLMTALRGLGLSTRFEAAPLLIEVLASPDAHLRATALEALGQHRSTPAVKERLLSGLFDRAAPVRAVAARALIDWGVDCAKDLGRDFGAQLQAHVEIARQNWPGIIALGARALPALAVAVEDVDEVIRREAQWTAAQLLGEFCQPRGPI